MHHQQMMHKMCFLLLFSDLVSRATEYLWLLNREEKIKNGCGMMKVKSDRDVIVFERVNDNKS